MGGKCGRPHVFRRETLVGKQFSSSGQATAVSVNGARNKELLGQLFVASETPIGKVVLREALAKQHEDDYVESIVRIQFYRADLMICKLRHTTGQNS